MHAHKQYCKIFGHCYRFVSVHAVVFFVLSNRENIEKMSADAQSELNKEKIQKGDEKPAIDAKSLEKTRKEIEEKLKIESDKKTDDRGDLGCEGPNSKYVKLISLDKHEFVVKREYANISPTIAAMMSGPGECLERETNDVNFREIPSHVVKVVCRYFAYKIKYTNCTAEIPMFPIDADAALEVLMAANFLDC